MHYFGNKILKCQECGHYYSADTSSREYVCNQHKPQVLANRCGNSDTININVLDSILWAVARTAHTRYLAPTFGKSK